MYMYICTYRYVHYICTYFLSLYIYILYCNNIRSSGMPYCL